jgi:hypothetical protein
MITPTHALLRSRVAGDFVSVGVSYGVTAKVLYELLIKGHQRAYHLVDPFVGKEGWGYCQDPAFVMAQFGGDPLLETPEVAQARLLKDIKEWADNVRLAKIVPQG